MSDTELTFPQLPAGLLQSTDDVVVTLREDINQAYQEAGTLYREYRSLDNQDAAIEAALADPNSPIEQVTRVQAFRAQIAKMTAALEGVEAEARERVKATLVHSDRSPEVLLALYKRQRNAIEDFRVPGVFDSVCEALEGWNLPTVAEVKSGKKATPRVPGTSTSTPTGNVRLSIDHVTAVSDVVDVEYRTMSAMSGDLGWNNQDVTKAAIAAAGGRPTDVVSFDYNGTKVTVYPKGWTAPVEAQETATEAEETITADEAIAALDFDLGDFE